MEVIYCSIMRFPNGVVKTKEFRKNGLRCSQPNEYYGRPSVAVYDQNGNAIEFLYYTDNGVLKKTSKYLGDIEHCAYEPSEIKWHDTGCIKKIEYKMFDKHYASNVHPSYLYFYYDGQIRSVSRIKTGHSEEYISAIEYYPNGLISYIKYSACGYTEQLRRMPIEFNWTDDGELDCIGYHLTGENRNPHWPDAIDWYHL